MLFQRGTHPVTSALVGKPRSALAVLLLTGALVTTVVWLAIQHAHRGTDVAAPVAHAGGDPGHLLLNQLKTVSLGVPTDARVQSVVAVEPQWDSCDGNASTAGWTDVLVGKDFTSPKPALEVISNVKERLKSSGWVVKSATDPAEGAPNVVWQHELPGRKDVARATLSLSHRDSAQPAVWSLVATAPPVGRRAGGC